MGLRREAEEATRKGGREGCCGPVDCDAPLGRPEPHDPFKEQGTWRDPFVCFCWFVMGVAATILLAIGMGWLR